MREGSLLIEKKDSVEKNDLIAAVYVYVSR